MKEICWIPPAVRSLELAGIPILEEI